jgi:hypothetical protein
MRTATTAVALFLALQSPAETQLQRCDKALDTCRVVMSLSTGESAERERLEGTLRKQLADAEKRAAARAEKSGGFFSPELTFALGILAGGAMVYFLRK